MRPPASVFEQIVSKPRLSSYRAYWKVSADEAVGLYMWNGEVCSAWSQLLSYFEIGLRNNIHRAMSESTAGVGSSSHHWWDKVWPQLPQATKTKVSEIRMRAPSTTPDELVSRLSFGFWPNMAFWIAKNRSGLLPKVFPGHPLSQGHPVDWNHAPSRRAALNELSELKDARNRIAHHEPLWKFPHVVDTSTHPATIVAAASTNDTATFARFARLLAIYDAAIAALSADLFAHIRRSSWRRQLDFLLSPKGKSRDVAGLHVVGDRPHSAMALHQQFGSVVGANQPVRIEDAGGAGVFYPV